MTEESPGSRKCEVCGTELPEPTAPCPGCASTEVKLTKTVTDGTGSARPHARVDRIASYRIVKELGAGGMGSVYLAHDEKMNRQVALKVLAPHLAPSSKAERRFEHEAWIAGRLDHPNLVKVYEQGTWEGLSYFSMELIDGGSLNDVIVALRKDGRDRRWNLQFGTREYNLWAITQVIAAARGLEYAHRHGVVHRDIKPMNLMLCRELDTVKIADFGLAIDADVTRLTSAGAVLGTVVYMAPEQILGKQGEIDGRTDVYALGVTLFELLTLQLPFSAKSQEMYFNEVLNSEARRPGKLNDRVGRDLEIVIGKALSKQPADRYQTAGEFADDLENVLDFRPIQARPTGRIKRVTKWARRKPVHAALVVTLTLGLPTVAVLTHRALEARRVVAQNRVEELAREVNWLAQSSRFEELFEKAAIALDVDPDNVEILRSRALARKAIALATDHPEDAATQTRGALEDLSRIIEVLPEAAWPYRLQAHLYRQFDRQEEAEAATARAVELQTGEPSEDDLYLDAVLALDNQDEQRAIELLSRLILLDPSNRAAIIDRAWAHSRLGHTEEAIRDYRVAAVVDPSDFFTFYGLARTLVRDGQWDAAEDYLERARKLKPDSVYVHEALSDNYFRRGSTALGSGDRAGAKTAFESATREARSALAADEELPWAHINLGVSLVAHSRLADGEQADQIAEATSHYERARELLQGSDGVIHAGAYSTLLVNLCDAQIETENLDRALETCLEVTQKMPDNPVAFYNLAGVYALTDRPDEAFVALERNYELGDRDFGYLQNDPWFESLRDEPRFGELILRMKRE
jgi:serine/threonine protein kinase/Flp pilus assembly protein TadD